MNIFPEQVAEALTPIPGLGREFQLVLDRTAPLDRLEVHIEVAQDSAPDNVGGLIKMEQQVEEQLQSLLGMAVAVKLVQPGSIDTTQGRSRIIDATQDD